MSTPYACVRHCGRLPFLDDTQGVPGYHRLMTTTPSPGFTLSQLEYFIATVETGSFTAAAAALDVSQPAVAEQIQRLERSVGQSLFARRARGVELTAAGRDLEPHARRVLDAARIAATAMQDANTVGAASVAFGTFGAPHHYGIEELITSFFDRHPTARLRVAGRNSSATADAVRSGDLDAAVIALPIDETGLDVRPIFDGEVFYVSIDADRVCRPVTIADLCGRPFILYEASAGSADPTRSQLAARAQAAGLRLQPRLEVEAAETALRLAADGVADTYVPQVLVDTIDDHLRITSFDPPLIDTFALVTRTGARLSRPVADLVERVTEHLVARVDRARR